MTLIWRGLCQEIGDFIQGTRPPSGFSGGIHLSDPLEWVVDCALRSMTTMRWSRRCVNQARATSAQNPECRYEIHAIGKP